MLELIVNLSNIGSFLLSIAIGFGVIRLIRDVTSHRDDRLIKTVLGRLIEELQGQKPLKSDTDEKIEQVIQLVQDDYIRFYYFKRKRRIKEIRSLGRIDDANRQAFATKLKLLRNSIITERDFYDE